MRPPLGQHFLRDPLVVRTLIGAAELTGEDSVIEIGPGKGVMTEALAGRVRRLTAIELDAALAHRLAARFADRPHVRILHGDFLNQNLSALAPESAATMKILGNLPYAITAPIFEKILAWPLWRTGVFLIQKEVAERMSSAEGSRTYGILSLAVQLFSTVEILRTVPPGAFQPPPAVFSSVIRLRRKPHAELPENAIADFFDLVHGAFAHRRKTIANSLALHSQADKKRIAQWLESQAVSPVCRAETLALGTYVRLTAPWAVFRRESGI